MTKAYFRGGRPSGRAAVLADALRQGTEYRRAAGYFASSVFEVAEGEFEGFFQRGGTMRLVCSPAMMREDVDCFRGVFFYERPARKPSSRRHMRLLEKVLRERQLLVKIAYPTSGRGIYHEKFGVVSGPAGKVGFVGSANETWSGYQDNFELLRLMKSPGDAPDAEELRYLAKSFDLLWGNKVPGLEVTELREALQRGIVQAQEGAPDGPPGSTKVVRMPDSPRETIRTPSDIVLRDHQREAIRAWIAAGGKGILAMATGSGKTITALAAAERVLDGVGPPLVLVVVAPYRHLVNQWIREAQRFGLKPIACSSDNPEWREQLSSGIFAASHGDTPVVSAVVTNATFSSPPFQALIDTVQTRAMLVADEVHNFGATFLSRALPDRWSIRMGLSATPSRRYDEVGSQKIKTYFGDIVARFDIRDALAAKPPVLTPYQYRPELVHLEAEEVEQYMVLTDKIARTIRDATDDDIGEVALALLVKRARLVATARQKMPRLERIMGELREESHILIYCGDGSTEIEGAGDEADEPTLVRQVEQAASLVGYKFGMSVATYTAATPMQEREELRKDFALGKMQVLVAIRCLDEGVDFPEARKALILASSTNPRQFIQRRGRILRRAPGKTMATIHDFVVVPPPGDDADPSVKKTIARLFRKEMERVIEFAETATNKAQVRASLLPMLREQDMLDLA